MNYRFICLKQRSDIILNNDTDKENPVIDRIPGNINLEADPGSASIVVVWLEPVASDNSGSVYMTSSHKPGYTFPIGVTTVTYRAEDPSSNIATIRFNVTVIGKWVKTDSYVHFFYYVIH